MLAIRKAVLCFSVNTYKYNAWKSSQDSLEQHNKVYQPRHIILFSCCLNRRALRRLDSRKGLNKDCSSSRSFGRLYQNTDEICRIHDMVGVLGAKRVVHLDEVIRAKKLGMARA